MKIFIEVDINNCKDCLYKKYHYGHGECWYYCSHPDNGRGGYENILWGCQEEFKEIPEWCPLPLEK